MSWLLAVMSWLLAHYELTTCGNELVTSKLLAHHSHIPACNQQQITRDELLAPGLVLPQLDYGPNEKHTAAATASRLPHGCSSFPTQAVATSQERICKTDRRRYLERRSKRETITKVRQARPLGLATTALNNLYCTSMTTDHWHNL
jgi:hypothetical protein